MTFLNLTDVHSPLIEKSIVYEAVNFLFCCQTAAGKSFVHSVWMVIFNKVSINVWKVCLELLP